MEEYTINSVSGADDSPVHIYKKNSLDMTNQDPQFSGNPPKMTMAS